VSAIPNTITKKDRREQVPLGHRGHRVVRDDSRTTSVSDGGACDDASPPVNSTPRPGRSRFATASPISPANVVVTA